MLEVHSGDRRNPQARRGHDLGVGVMRQGDIGLDPGSPAAQVIDKSTNSQFSWRTRSAEMVTYSCLEHTSVASEVADRIASATSKQLMISGSSLGRWPFVRFRITRVPSFQIDARVPSCSPNNVKSTEAE